MLDIAPRQVVAHVRKHGRVVTVLAGHVKTIFSIVKRKPKRRSHQCASCNLGKNYPAALAIAC